MPKDDKQPQKELKVTDKRIFTADGDIREEFRDEIRPVAPAAAPAPAPQAAEAEPEPPPQQSQEQQPKAEEQHKPEERRRSLADRAENPGTPFGNFIEPLIAQAYMSLGLLRSPYQPQSKIDAGAARQMIEILQLMQEKTKGNLTPEESDFLDTHLGELKLAYVQRTKSI